MRIEIPLEPQAAKRPKVNSMVNSTYYDTNYRKWLDEAMGWVENYLIETDFACLSTVIIPLSRLVFLFLATFSPKIYTPH